MFTCHLDVFLLFPVDDDEPQKNMNFIPMGGQADIRIRVKHVFPVFASFHCL